MFFMLGLFIGLFYIFVGEVFIAVAKCRCDGMHRMPFEILMCCLFWPIGFIFILKCKKEEVLDK